MSTSRKLIPKNQPRVAEAVVSDSSSAPTSQETSQNSSALPKHIPFPDLEGSSELVVEGLIFVIAVFAMGCQYLEMYRTVWWLPEMANKKAMHFHLIDKSVVAFIVCILVRKFLALLVLNGVKYLKKCHKSYHTLANCMPWIYVIQLGAFLGACCLDIYMKYGILNILCLCYPLFLYLIIFKWTLEPFFRNTFETQAKYFNGIPLHCCSTKPCTIRSEVDGLRCDFNNRFKQTIFSSIIYGYYAGFMPYWFVDPHLFYDPVLVLLNAFFIWVSALTMCAVQCFPPKYCDILHRAALHLGQWERLDPKLTIPNLPSWSPTIKCLPNTMLRHEGEFYRATGPITTAIPGNSTHFRFYTIFKNPTTIYGILSAVQLLLMGTQTLRLYHSTQWHTIISLSYFIFTNFATMFCLLRNLRVVHSIYSDEAAILAGVNNSD